MLTNTVIYWIEDHPIDDGILHYEITEMMMMIPIFTALLPIIEEKPTS